MVRITKCNVESTRLHVKQFFNSLKNTLMYKYRQYIWVPKKNFKPTTKINFQLICWVKILKTLKVLYLKKLFTFRSINQPLQNYSQAIIWAMYLYILEVCPAENILKQHLSRNHEYILLKSNKTLTLHDDP